MKTNAPASTDVLRITSSVESEDSESLSVKGSEQDADSFASSSVAKESIKYRRVFKDAQELWDIPLEEIEAHAQPTPQGSPLAREEKFIAHPSTQGFLKLAHHFDKTMRVVGHETYQHVNDIAVQPASTALVALDLATLKKEQKLEYWHEKSQLTMDYKRAKEELKTRHRNQKITEKGLGYGGKMTTKVGTSKEAAFYAKNNLTLRGNVFKLTHKLCPRNIYEIMPRYGYRKSAHIGVRVSQFTLTTVLAALGYGLAPASFGVSKIVTDHVRTVVTLSGEVITFKIAGADNHKCMVHAGLRGVQLEVPRLIPFVGDVINIGEGIAFGTAAAGIVSTTLADMILAQYSDRYISSINIDDLGDSRCLEELNSRIDYLSQFMLPYGQYLLLKETDLSTRKKLKKCLKENFSLLRDLEKKKVESLNFYRLGLAAQKIPASHREKIRMDCEKALPDTRINTHRIAKRCLAELIANDPELKMAKRQTASSKAFA